VTREWTVSNAKPVTSTKTITVVAFMRDRVDTRPAGIDFVLASRFSGGGGGGKGGKKGGGGS
jgi:hypothetical protein